MIRIDGDRLSAAHPTQASQRLVVLGEMTGGLAHDLKNILTVIDSGLRLADSHLDDPDKIRRVISGSREGVARGLTLISRLMTFALQGEVSRCPADVNSLLEELQLFLQYSAGPSVRIILELSPGLPRCLLDPPRFSTAVLNLVVNARDAMPSRGGEVRIVTSHLRADAAPSTKECAGHYVRVRVQDNGSGMPDEILRRVFEPFFTTKGQKGTGQGVPQVNAFMRQIGGHMTVDSLQGCGTTVDLFFPAAEMDIHGDVPSEHSCWRSADDRSHQSLGNT